MIRPIAPDATIVASRQVSKELQEEFADFSGDRNPMHIDELAARRTPAGKPVVHGMHTLLWALDSLYNLGRIGSHLTGIKVTFLKWVYLCDVCELLLPLGESVNPRLLEVRARGMPVLTAELDYGDYSERGSSGSLLCGSTARNQSSANDLLFSQMEDRSGYVLPTPPSDAATLFPHLSASVSAAAVAELAACSYIVGMECPGLNSIFSKLDLVLARGPGLNPERAGLHYQAIRCDERFQKVRIAVTGHHIAGTLEAFMRSPPVGQISMQSALGAVGPGEFAGMNALIIGGSRGLGELAAKLIAAGGGSSTITYSQGKHDAECVAAEVRACGGTITVSRYDVCLPPAEQLACFEDEVLHISHLFYFATNHIFQAKGELVSARLLADFTTFYVLGFYDLCARLVNVRQRKNPTLIAYYPSSTAVEERPLGMTEYSMAKAAGEQMCRDMNQYMQGLQVLVTRLPRLRTDQTATVIPTQDADAVTVLLPIIRHVHLLSKI
jgi:hypothetical protein